MWFTRQIVAFFWGAALLACLGAPPAFAQENQSPVPQAAQSQQHYWDCISPICTYVQSKESDKPPQPYGGGTPLDVFLNTKLWTDAPEAKPFVKATRPPEDTLHYQTTGGKDIARPKLKTSAELQQMEDELERAGAAGDRAAGIKSHFHVETRKIAKRAGETSHVHRSASPSAAPLGAADAARASRQ